MSKKVLSVLLVLFGLSTMLLSGCRWGGSSQQRPTPAQSSTKQTIATPIPTPTPTIAPITLLFGGDMMFDRHIRDKAGVQGNYDFILADLRAEMNGVDLAVANLEGPVTDNDSRSVGSIPGESRNYSFTFDPQISQTLKNYNLDLVNLGNNHILNFGSDGLAQTQRWLSQAGIEYFGHASASGRLADEMKVVDIRGTKILFANYNQFIDTDVEKLLAALRAKKTTVDYIVLYTHWGNEYMTEAGPVIQNLAHRFIDEGGVDLIIGSHPHVVQQSEDYKGKRIYYSLGNFVFDQYFQPEVKAGLLVKTTIDPRTQQFAFAEIPIQLKNTGETVREKGS